MAEGGPTIVAAPLRLAPPNPGRLPAWVAVKAVLSTAVPVKTTPAELTASSGRATAAVFGISTPIAATMRTSAAANSDQRAGLSEDAVTSAIAALSTEVTETCCAKAPMIAAAAVASASTAVARRHQN